MFYQIETITPEIARSYLSTSVGNRKESNVYIDRYADDMRSGRWVVNGEPIIFSDHYELLDGHHRLMACIKAGVPFRSLVIRGVDKSAVTTFDIGKNRNVSDVCAFVECNNGTGKHTRYVSSIMRFLIAYDASDKLADMARVISTLSPTRIYEYMTTHMYEVNILRNLPDHIRRNNTPMGAAVIVAIRHGYAPDQVVDFFARSAKGVMLAPNTPEFVVLSIIRRNDISMTLENRLALFRVFVRLFYMATQGKKLKRCSVVYNGENKIEIQQKEEK